jgi:hypothetical protein
MPLFDGPFYPVILLTIICILGLLFLYTQQRILQRIHPENRKMRPGKVWLQLIPLFGMVYAFIVVVDISESLKRELPNSAEKRPSLVTGLLYNGLFWSGGVIGRITKVDFMELYVAMAAFAVLLVYWMQLLHYNRKLSHSQAIPTADSGTVPL